MATSGPSSSSPSPSSSLSSRSKRRYLRSRGRRGSSSSSSLRDHSYLCAVPKSASLWKKQHLESLGIFYNENPSTTTEILAVLKRQVADLNIPEEIPEIGQKLIELTKQIFNFSFDFTDDPSEQINRKMRREMERISVDFGSLMSDFRSQNHDFLQDRTNERVYQYWVVYASEFLSYLRIFMVRYRMLGTRERIFAQLLGQFTRLCLLVPENGNSLVSTLNIKGKKVSGIPDVRFPSHEKGDQKTVTVVTMAEVKLSDELKGNTDNFHIGNLPDGVLGQHGVELLLENNNSFFQPAISGLICIGTKLIFTVLEIARGQYKIWQRDDVQEIDIKSTILYSKPYDYMDNYELSDILEICFWLGYIQRDAYKSLVPF